MIVYFDTSALVPLLAEEQGTTVAVALWTSAEARASARFIVIEAAAALALAQRIGRPTWAELTMALRSRDLLVDGFNLVETTPMLIEKAAELAVSEKLRGYDAVHCAAGLSLASDDFVAAAGDRDLIAAWRSLGVATASIG